MVDIKDIEQIYSKQPFIRKPNDVYIFKSGRIHSDVFFDLGMFHAQSRFVVRGMTPSERSEAIFTGDSTRRTVIHEALHNTGLKSEMTVRPLAALKEAILPFRLGILGQPVKYEQVPMTKEETARYLKSIGVEPMQADTVIYHYRIVSGGT
jgi:hypothetical protein